MCYGEPRHDRGERTNRPARENIAGIVHSHEDTAQPEDDGKYEEGGTPPGPGERGNHGHDGGERGVVRGKTVVRGVMDQQDGTGIVDEGA